MINSQLTVREIAVQVPESTKLFEKLNIDYCCGGNQPLTAACGAAGVNVDSVVQMLTELSESKAAPQPLSKLSELSLTDLITHIVDTHHVYTKEEMARLEALSDKVLGAHGANHPELVQVRQLIEQLFNYLRPHMFKEEEVLFPYIVEMDNAVSQNRPKPFPPFGTVNNPVRMMMLEHDTAGDILRELRSVTSQYAVPADACISYKTLYEALETFEKDLHQHIHLENNILFPKAVDMEAR